MTARIKFFLLMSLLDLLDRERDEQLARALAELSEQQRLWMMSFLEEMLTWLSTKE